MLHYSASSSCFVIVVTAAAATAVVVYLSCAGLGPTTTVSPRASVLFALASRIGRRRAEYSGIVLETAVPNLLERLVRASNPETATDGGPAAAAGGEAAGVAAVERASLTLVELCELPGVFAVAAPALLAGEIVVAIIFL